LGTRSLCGFLSQDDGSKKMHAGIARRRGNATKCRTSSELGALAARPLREQSDEVTSSTTFIAATGVTVTSMVIFASCGGPRAQANPDAGGPDARDPQDPDAMAPPFSDAFADMEIADTSEEMDLAACVADGPIGTPRDDCPLDLPDGGDCPTASPSYLDVTPVFSTKCSTCHQPGGLAPKFRFDSYAAIYNNRQTRIDIFTQIYNCRMPPSCAPNLSPEERKLMLEWFVCGAPNTPDGGLADQGASMQK
jgi:hypothetical protein